MEIWRAVMRWVDYPDWRSVNNKIYLERRYATLAMKHAAGRNVSWDDQEKVWVSQNGKTIYKIQKAVVEEWRDLVG
jgi:hypothetical protein